MKLEISDSSTGISLVLKSGMKFNVTMLDWKIGLFLALNL